MLVSSLARRTLLASAIAASLGASCAYAQNAASTTDSPVIGTVVVTAQRRSEVAQDVPIALSALDAQQIEALGLATAEDLVAAIPNMQVSMPYGSAQPIFSIRGVSMSDYLSNQPSPIGVYSDEAYLGAVYTHGLSFFDIERLEVLRGPQGTLYGKNTTGGAVNIITRAPDLALVNGYTSASAGDYGKLGFEGAVSLPLVQDRFAVRIAGIYEEDDGYIDNELTGTDMAQTKHWAMRISMLAQMSDAFDATLRIASGKSDPIATPPRGEGSVPLGGGVFADFNGYVRPADYDIHEGGWNRVGRLAVELDQIALKVNYEFDALTLTSVTSWYDASYAHGADTDGGPLSLLEIDWSTGEESFAQDLRIAADIGSAFELIAGAYFQTQDITMHNLYSAYRDGAGLVGLLDPALQSLLLAWGRLDHRMDTERQSTAIYGQGTVALSAALSIDLGLRYTEDEDVLAHHNVSRFSHAGAPIGTWVPGNLYGIDAPFLPPAFGGVYTDGPYTSASAPRQSVKNDAWTGRLSLNHEASDALLWYLSYSRGYRSGNFNAGTSYVVRTIDQGYAEPETIDAYELGLKSEWLDRRLRLNAAAFFYDYKDQQFVNVVGVSNFLENAGGAEVRGFEAELTALLSAGFTITASLGLLDTEFTQLTLANTLTDDASDTIDLAGNELISAPAVTGSIGADYEATLGSDWLMRFHLDANYRGEQWFSAYNDAIGYGATSADAYWLMNARVSLLPSDERWSAAAYVRNALDEEYDSYAINLSSGFGYNYLLAGAPRRYGVELTYRF